MDFLDHFDKILAAGHAANVKEIGGVMTGHNNVPSFCPSPGEDSTGSENINPVTRSNGSTNTTFHFDPAAFVLPLTPEDSVGSSSCTEFSDDTVLQEYDLAKDIDDFMNCKQSVLSHGKYETSGDMQFLDGTINMLNNDHNAVSFTPDMVSQNGVLYDDSIEVPESQPELNGEIAKLNGESEISTPAISSTCVGSNKDRGKDHNQISKSTCTKESKTEGKDAGQKLDGKKQKKARNPLKFPPCVICSGKASGSHYGAITCEACKGFFRRYLQKKIEYKCTKGGKCEIKSCNKGTLNCSGCRLKKCLDFGMSKTKSAIGRYTLTKRTEAIVRMNHFEGKETKENAQEDAVSPDIDSLADEIDLATIDPQRELLKIHVIQNVENLNRSGSFNEALVSELVEVFDQFKPYGPDVVTKEQITDAHKKHAERYKQKVELFGQMKCIPREEYNKIYAEFGIDLDGRMADMKLDSEDFEEDFELFYNFAKHIPGFYCLPIQDQINLLKFSMNDFFILVSIDSYSKEHQTFLSKGGRGYHFDEIAGREISSECCAMSIENFLRLQQLELSKVEMSLLAALMLTMTDRCKLKNHSVVENIYISLANLLEAHIKKINQKHSQRRFTKLIDWLVVSRDLNKVFTRETNEFCKDEVMLKEFPFLTEFVLEESDEN